MCISTKIRLNLLLYILIFLGAGVLLFVSFTNLRSLVAREQQVETLLVSILELGHLTERSFASQEIAPLWFSRYDLLAGKLADFQEKSKEQQKRVALIVAQYSSLKEIYLLMQDQREGGDVSSAAGELERRFRSQLQVKFHDIVAHFAQYNAVQRAKIVRAEKLFFEVIIGAFIFGSIAAISLFIWLRKSILVPLDQLNEATKVVGSGRFSSLAGDWSDDEIGELAQGFKEMTRNLALITTSRDNLEREIREREKAEMGRLEAERQLRQAQQMEAIGTMAGGFAHRFNNLLAGILGFTEMAVDDAKPGTSQHEFLEEILRSANSARDLVAKVMTFSNQAITRNERILPGQLVCKYAEKISAITRADSGILIEVESSDEISPIFMTPRFFHLILDNLCRNAIEAMVDGGKLQLRMENVSLSETLTTTLFPLQPGEYVLLTVSDSGCGFDAERADRIFDPFFTTKEVGEGDGIGLSMVIGLITKHGGSIGVESEPGHGSSFCVYLPAALEENNNTIRLTASGREGGS